MYITNYTNNIFACISNQPPFVDEMTWLSNYKPHQGVLLNQACDCYVVCIKPVSRHFFKDNIPCLPACSLWLTNRLDSCKTKIHKKSTEQTIFLMFRDPQKLHNF